MTDDTQSGRGVVRVMAAGVLVTVLALALCTPAFARSCGQRAQIVERLAERYGEHRTGRGLAHNNGLVELFASEETGTWTILITLPTGETCMVAAGDFWEQTPSGLARPGKQT